MSPIKMAAAAIAAAASLAAHAATFTDLWSNPQESGWGMSLVQQDDTAFVALFVYGTDGTPRWYTASEARIVAIAPGNLPIFSGTLYRTEGPYFGAGTFDPSKVRVIPAGTISVQALATDRVRVEYQADGASVAKELVRQTWSGPVAAGLYEGKFRLRQTPSNGTTPIGTFVYGAQVELDVEGGNGVLIAIDDFQRNCTYRGPYRQSGKLASMSGTYTCSGPRADQADAGTFEMTEIEATGNGITGVLKTTSPAMSQTGKFGAAKLIG